MATQFITGSLPVVEHGSANLIPVAVYNAEDASYKSAYIKFNDLLASLKGDIASKFAFGSAASKDTSYFSASDHIHQDYSKTEIIPARSSGLKVAEAVLDSSITPLFARKSDSSGVYVGDVKFTANKSVSNIDINAEDFDGWVYADGTSYAVQSNEFKEACLAFAGSESATSFTVPKLKDFFYAVPAKQALEHVEYKNAVPKHGHAILNVPVDFSALEYTIAVPGVSNWDDPRANDNIQGSHAGTEGSQGSLECSMGLKLETGNIDAKTEKTVKDVESYPAFTYACVMVYIGTK